MSNPYAIAPNSARSIVFGALFIIASALAFSVMHSLVRHIAADLHPFEVAFLRFAFGLAFLLPWLSYSGRTGLRTTRIRLHFLRAGLTVISTLMWFTAITLLPLAQAVALNFTAPLFATIGAALFLGETVRARRWIATLVGFGGVIVILRPGAAETTWPMLLPVAAAVTMAANVIVMKTLTRTDAPATVMFYQNFLSLPAFALAAFFFWQTPSWTLLGLAALVGLLGNAAHYCLTRGFSLADASLLMPLDYARLPFSAAVAFFAFAEVPDLWTWVGAGIIAASALYIARREALLARTRVLDHPTIPLGPAGP